MGRFTSTGLRQAALAAALVLGGGFLAGGTAQAAPLAAPPVDAIATESGLTAVHWRGRHHHHHHGHYHGRRHHGFGFGHRHHRHHHHHHHRGHRFH